MIMKWSEIKKWAKSKGYEVDRTKKEKNKYLYNWVELSNPNNKGRAQSTFDLAKDVYNNMTDNRHLAYQKAYNSSSNVYIENPLKYH
jgi:hypothetical protein